MCVCCFVCYVCVFFFFKQKTAYEMRISDWSSDVCSSDLDTIVESKARRAATFPGACYGSCGCRGCPAIRAAALQGNIGKGRPRPSWKEPGSPLLPVSDPVTADNRARHPPRFGRRRSRCRRSEERRAGQECVST